MTTRSFKMWNESGKISLYAILKELDGSGLAWKIEYFDGVGKPPSRFFSQSLIEFEIYLKNSDQGFQLAWAEMLEFSEEIEDLMDIDVIGFSLNGDQIVKNIIIQGFDSTEWTITVSS